MMMSLVWIGLPSEVARAAICFCLALYTTMNAAMDVKLSLSYAPTGRATCKFCHKFIQKDTARLSKTIHLPWIASRGNREAHFHLNCGVNVIKHAIDKGEHLRVDGVNSLSQTDLLQLERLYVPVAPALFRTHRLATQNASAR